MCSKNTLIHKIIAISILGLIAIPILSSQGSAEEFQSSNQNPRSSVVAGNEFYAEQITASVYGDISLLTHSLVTNDSNIFQRLDFTDPAFHDASLVISASNGKASLADPSVFTPGLGQMTGAFGSNAFFGFLYYNNVTSLFDIQERSPRAFRILSEALQLDLIRYDTGSNRFFPFVGYYPRWDVFQNVLFSGVPKDGYFGVIDYSRLSSAAYLAAKPFSGTIVLLDNIDVLEQLADVAGNYYNIDVAGLIEMPSFNLGQLDITTLAQGFGGIPFMNTTDLLGVGSSLGAFTSILGTGDLESFMQDSRVLGLVAQYEGDPAGIVKNYDGTYTFDLFKALNYTGTQLKPSKSIYIALVGALFSAVTVNLFSAEVVDFTPKRCDFSSSLIERIELATFITGQDIDLSMLTDYSFKTFWETTGGQSVIYANIYNPTNNQDILNSLYQLGMKGTPGIPLGLLNPLSAFWVRYAIPDAELMLGVKTSIDTGFNNITGESSQFINVSNVGNRDVWGVVADRPFVSAEQVIGALQDTVPGVYNYLEEFAWNTFDQTMEEFLGMKDARNFYLDTNGDGAYDAFYPNPYDTNGLYPYNPDFAMWLLSPMADSDEVFGALGAVGQAALSAFFNNTQSIFNPENYKLSPGDGFTYESNSVTASTVNTWSSFEEYNYTQGTFPSIVYGQSIDGTTPVGGLAVNDTLRWNISSQQVGVQHQLQVIFKFQNSTIPNPVKELDQLRLVWRGMNNVSLAGNLQWAIFNRSAGESGLFEDFTWDTNNVNDSYATTTHNFNAGFANLTDAANNYTTFLRLTVVADAPFHISIDDFNLNFTMLDTNGLDLGSAHVTYSTQESYNRLTVTANNALLTTRDAPSLVGQAELKHIISDAGELNTYTLRLVNNGTRSARDVNVTVDIPGIIVDTGNFTLHGNTLNCSVGDIPAHVLLANISFTFRTPNTLLIPQARIDYDNFIDLQANKTDFSTVANQIFLTAPIDYDTRVPYLNRLSYMLSANATAPAIGEHVNVTITVQNTGSETVREINLLWGTNLEGLACMSDSSFRITNLLPGAGNARTLSVILNKTTYRGYLIPPIAAINGTESQTIRQTTPSPIILGLSSLRITRSASERQPEPGDIITIIVNITNNGSIDMEDMLVNDINCFPQDGFTLNSGILVFSITKLAPGESTTFNYTLKAKNQGHYDLRPAEVSYFFIYKETFESPTYMTVVKAPSYILMLYFAVPLVASLICIAIYYGLKKKSQKEDYELRRREELMFGKTGTQVAWHKKVLTQVLDDIQEGGG